MNIDFCQHYIGDGSTKSNKYCRECPHSSIACDKLWNLVVNLSKSNNDTSIPLPETNAVMLPNSKNPNIVYMRVNAQWNFPKEDFLHYIATGHAQLGKKEQRQNPSVSPSLTRQEPYVQAIVKLLGGMDIQEIVNVKRVQSK